MFGSHKCRLACERFERRESMEREILLTPIRTTVRALDVMNIVSCTHTRAARRSHYRTTLDRTPISYPSKRLKLIQLISRSRKTFTLPSPSDGLQLCILSHDDIPRVSIPNLFKSVRLLRPRASRSEISLFYAHFSFTWPRICCPCVRGRVVGHGMAFLWRRQRRI